jgi:hypothetical protein
MSAPADRSAAPTSAAQRVPLALRMAIESAEDAQGRAAYLRQQLRRMIDRARRGRSRDQELRRLLALTAKLELLCRDVMHGLNEGIAVLQ